MATEENTVASILDKYGIKYEREHKFHPSRKWRFDFYLPDYNAAIEFEGGIWQDGRHTRGSGFVADCVKYNSATIIGIRVFRVAPSHVKTGYLDDLLHELKHGGDGSYEGPMHQWKLKRR